MKRKQADYDAFVDLACEHQGILHRICSIYASSNEDHEDLYQEILLQGLRSFASFQGQSKFSTWLYRVALNTALVYRRRDKARRRVSFETVDDVDGSTNRGHGQSGDVELLYHCIQQLPRLDRAIVLLHLERHSYEEIAEITGLSRGNVSVRLVRIKQRLRQLLLAGGYGEG
jgi:RNA polymerase sigma-70 factor, ECF subfamily